MGKQTFSVLNPGTGGEAGWAFDMGENELDATVEAAKRAFADWSSRSSDDLQAICTRVTDEIEAHSEELAKLVTLEQGKPLNGLGSRWELGNAVAWARHTTKLNIPMKVIQDNEEGRVELHRKPMGVVGSILPWNFPVMIAIWHVMPALRTGNTVVIKPSPYTPLATMRLVEIMNKVLPSGVLNILTAVDGAFNMGAAMSSHPDIRKIVFTGSIATGRQIMTAAASTTKRLTLEMSGNDAAIVLPDADPKAIAENLFWGMFINNGQTCASLKRLYVHDSIHDAVCDELVSYARNVKVGYGLDETSMLGPVQNHQQFAKLSRLVGDAKKCGKVILGGEPAEGLFFQPTIITGLKNGDPLVNEEQFGPALPIVKYSTVDEAIALANDSENGLAGSVWSSDIAKAKQVAGRMECGSVWINKHGTIQPNAPFGGVKSSGIGVEFAKEGLLEYTNIQTIFVQA